MKIVVTTNASTNEVLHVYSIDYYLERGKTMEEIEKAVLDTNIKNTEWMYQIINVPDNMVEAMKFLLGEDKYVASATIRGLKNKVQNCIDGIEDLKSDLFDMSHYFEDVARDLQKFVKEQEKD